MKKVILLIFLLVPVTTFAQELKNTRKLASTNYLPIKVEGNVISLSNCKIELDKTGFPKQIQTSFSPSANPTNLLYENIHFHFVGESTGKNNVLKDSGVRFLTTNRENEKGIVKWESTNKNDTLLMEVEGSLKPNGDLVYRVKVIALQTIALKDVTMHIPFVPTVPSNMIGFGISEGTRPEKVEWKWDGPSPNQHHAWLGNSTAGLQYSLKKGAWSNKAKGGVIIGIKGSSMLANNYTGEHTMKKGDVLHYDFSLLVRPFESIEMK